MIYIISYTVIGFFLGIYGSSFVLTDFNHNYVGFSGALECFIYSYLILASMLIWPLLLIAAQILIRLDKDFPSYFNKDFDAVVVHYFGNIQSVFE
jgi:hypothetical protein